ncbi:MAG: bifunctional adenosylcobinamide kinase/adenosylcobinamide-phosphate guanylyltransferase [Desulfobacterales bacterium]
MKETVLIIGGCRSGKSRYALELATQAAGRNRIFVATCVPGDNEMEERVRRHQKERSQSWTTVEAPLSLVESVDEHGRQGNVIVVDCLTLWLSNLLLEINNPEEIEVHIKKLTQSLEASQCPVFLVSNEVGTGIVPENRLARRFRDVAGFANQKVAACSDMVIWMVAGIPVSIKPSIS